MVDVSRRLFLGGALAIAGASVVPAAAEALAPLPRIVGDGVHDDTAGIQALINGEKARIEDACVQVGSGGRIAFHGGRTFIISAPLVISRSDMIFDGGGATFQAVGEVPYFIKLEARQFPLENISIGSVHFER